jgi:phosphate transport system substrate-binding protein
MGQRAQTDDLITQADLDETLAANRLAPENPRLRQAAANLVRWQMLERLGEEYTFFIEDTGRWVGRERPLEQVIRSELAPSRSQAEALYQAARQDHQAGQPQAAIDKLQQALALQADHLPARALLAKILQEEGRLAEAVAEYEKAYQQDHSIGPGLLAPALVAYGISLEEGNREAEALAAYERALAINPADPAVQARLAALKQRWVTPPRPNPEPRPKEGQTRPANRRAWWLVAAGLLLALLLFLICGQGYNPFSGVPAATASPAAAKTVATPTVTTPTVVASPTAPATATPLAAAVEPSPTATATAPAQPSPTATEALPSPTPVATATAATITNPTPVPTPALEGQIRVAGSTSMGRLARDLAGAFDFASPEAKVEITVREGGSQAGLEALRQGEVEVALVSREVTEAELGDNLRVFPLAQKEVIAVVVHPLVTMDSLTLEQVRAIFAGEVTTWDEVGGSETSIVVVTRPEGSGTQATFEQIVMGEGNSIIAADSTLSVPSNEAMRGMVSANPYAIGYMALEYTQATPPFAPGQVDWAVLDTALLEVKPLALDGVEPNTENALAGSYSLVRPFNMVTQATPDGVTQAWLDFIFSPEGQNLIERTGHLPAAP